MDPKRRKTGDQDISELRLASRQKYLGEREALQLSLLSKQVQEEAEEEDRLGAKLSRSERAEFARNRSLLKIALERQNIDEHLDGYILPDADYSNKEAVLTKRHKEKDYEKSEVQLWEDEQSRRVLSNKQPERVQADDYDYVFDPSQSVIYDGPLVDLEKQRLQSRLDEAEQKAQTIEQVQRSLPVYQYKDEFIEAVREHPALIFQASTGSGKTTQLTQYLAEAGFAKEGRIGCTQPRRVAAMSVAQRVSDELGSKLGQKCGYSVRFESRCSDATEIEYMTDGLMLRYLMSDFTLEKYSVIILDEAHERTTAGDMLFVFLRDLCRQRPSFRLIVASATLDAGFFSKYFDDAPILSVPGKTHKITRLFSSSPEANYLNAAVTTVFQIHLSQGPGDILVFLCGEDEILAAQEFIETTAKKLGGAAGPLIVCPVYGALPSEAQQLIFQPTPPGFRKVVLATNIAETSLTIDNIVFTIDNGLQKQNSYDNRTGQTSLQIVPCSRASAEQRAGRAGRTGPGMAFRLYTKYAFYNELPESQAPQLLRECLDGPVLMLKALGINDIFHFDFPDKPAPETLAASLTNLYALGFLDSTGAVTKVGRRASLLPLSPSLSKALLAAESFGCVDEMITLVSMVSEAGSLFFAPKDKKMAAEASRARFASAEGGDLISFLRIWNEFVESSYDPRWCKENFLIYRSLNRVRDVREQLQKLCDSVELPSSSCGISDHVPILKAFTSGYFSNTSRLNSDGLSYRTIKAGLPVYIHPSSCLKEKRPRLVVYFEQMVTTKEWMRSVSPIEPAWLMEVAPHYFKKEQIDDLNIGKKTSKGAGKVGIDG